MATAQVTAPLASFSMQLRSRKKQALDTVDDTTSHHRTTLRNLIAEAGASLPSLPEPKIEAQSKADTNVSAPNKSKARKGKDVEQQESTVSISEIEPKPANKRRQQAASSKAPAQSPIAPANKRTRGGKASIPPMVITETAQSPAKAKAENEAAAKPLSPALKESPVPAFKRGKRTVQEEVKPTQDAMVSSPSTKSMLPKQRDGKKGAEAPAAKGKAGTRKRQAVASPEKVETVADAQIGEEEAVTGFVASPAFIPPAPAPTPPVMVESDVALTETQSMSLTNVPAAAASRAKSATPIKSSRKQAKIQKREQESGLKPQAVQPSIKPSFNARNPFASPLAASVKIQPPPHPLLQQQQPVAAEVNEAPPPSSSTLRVTPKKKTASPSPLQAKPSSSHLSALTQESTAALVSVEAIEMSFSFAPVPPASSPAQMMMVNEAQAGKDAPSPGLKTGGTEQLGAKQRPKALRVPVSVAAPAVEPEAKDIEGPIVSLKADLLSPPLPVAALPLIIASPAQDATAVLESVAAAADKDISPAPLSFKGKEVQEISITAHEETAIATIQPKSSHPPMAPGGNNLVGAIRSFLPQKKAASPQIAAGKKPVRVKALEMAQAAKKAEEARLALHSAAAASSVVPPAIVVGGQVKAKAAAFQQRIEASQKSNAPISSLPQPLISKQPSQASNVRAQPFGSFAAPKTALSSVPSGSNQSTSSAHANPPSSSATAAATADDKHKRAEMRRKEEEDRKRVEMEAKQKLKEDRMKAVVAPPANNKAAAPAPPKVAAPAPLQPSKSVNQASSAPAPQSTKKAVKAQEAAPLPQEQAAQAEKPASLNSKPLPTTKGTPNAVNKAHLTDSAQHPPLTPADLKNIQKLLASPYVSRAPASVKKPISINYEISPYRPNADEEDEDEWAEQSRKKTVPEWALPMNLAPALVTQTKIDPDRIFNWRQKTCPLEEIFEGMPPLPAPTDPAKAKKPKRDWRKRGSSGDWIRDRLTWQEDLDYRKAMNYV